MVYPTKPYFVVKITGNQTSGNIVIFNSVVSQVGSGFNTGTGIFTAPISGLYRFSASVTFFTGIGGTWTNPGFYINGPTANVATVFNYGITVTGNGNAGTYSASGEVYLTAGQTAYVYSYVAASATAYISGSSSSFSGCLLM
jgi:hypothetical protein